VTHLVLVALKDAPVHHALMEAYRKAFLRQRDVSGVTWIVSDEYVKLIRKEDQVVALGPGRSYASILRRIPSQIARIRRLRREEVIPDSSGENGDSHVFVEAMHPNHWALMRHLRRILPRPSIRYYLHEPTGWAEKVAKGDGLFHATTVYLTQWVDMFQPDVVYVSSPRLAERLGKGLYLVPGLRDRVRVLPLPFADVAADLVPETMGGPASRSVLFLGRADERRCMDVFFATAAEAHRRGNGWTFVMLSGSSPAIPPAAASLPNLRLEIGRRYSDEDQHRELRQAGYVFNLYRVKYSQSGVSPVSLMFGVPLIANAQERHPELEKAGCLYFDEDPSPGELMDRLEARPDTDRAAIRRHYLATHDASGLVIP
jgi:hypothetical protein